MAAILRHDRLLSQGEEFLQQCAAGPHGARKVISIRRELEAAERQIISRVVEASVEVVDLPAVELAIAALPKVGLDRITSRTVVFQYEDARLEPFEAQAVEHFKLHAFHVDRYQIDPPSLFRDPRATCWTRGVPPAAGAARVEDYVVQGQEGNFGLDQLRALAQAAVDMVLIRVKKGEHGHVLGDCERGCRVAVAAADRSVDDALWIMEYHIERNRIA